MMRRFLIIFVGFMLCSWMTSCYTTQQVLLSSQELKERYIGKTEKEIKQIMGPPTRETTDGDDGSILIYESNAGSVTTVTHNKYRNTTYYNTTQNPDDYSWFYLDSKGVCTYVKTNSLTKQVRAYNPGITAALIVGLGIPALIFGAMAIFMR